MVAGGSASAASARVLPSALSDQCSGVSVQAVTSASCPGAPMLLIPEVGSTQVTLSWTTPASGGSPIIGYKVYVGTKPGGESGTAGYKPLVTSPYTVMRLKNGITYYFTVTAVNRDGEGLPSNEVPATPTKTPPGAPAGLTATASNGTVSLSWAAPDGGSQITGYNVYQGTSSDGESGTPVNGFSLVQATSYQVTGLTDGTKYYFKVSAFNQTGQGPTSNEAMVTPAATAPGAPSGLAVTPGDGKVTLSWTAPTSDGGSGVTGYKVYVATSAHCKGAGIYEVAGTALVLEGLANGTLYYFRVTAVNDVGEGKPSSTVSATPVGGPEAPSGLAATPGDGKVALSWTAPASDCGSQVTGYKVYVATSADFKGAGIYEVAGTALVLEGLANGTSYYFRVTAVDDVGESGPSNVANATPVGVPGTPTGLAAAPGDRQVTLTWDPPASDGGSPVTGYDLYVGTTAHFGGRAPLAEVTGRTVIVTGLANGTTYYFRVTAVSKVGQGPPSNEVPAVPLTVPGAPTGLTATPGNSNVTLAWTAPASGGAPIKGYIIYQGTSPGGETGTPVNGSLVTGTSYIVTGLTSGTTYFFKVVAVNAAGLSPLSAEASAKFQVMVPPATTAPATTAPATTAPATTTPALTAPTGLTATPGDTQVHLSWTAPMSDGGSPVASYKIYVARVPGVQELPAVGTAKTTDATVTRLPNRAVYYFMVTAVNTAGNESPLSTEVSAEPAGSAPGRTVSLNQPTIPPQLIALITAAAAIVTAVGFTLITRGRSGSGSRKHERPKRSRQEIEVGSDVRAVADAVRIDAVSVRGTGQEPTHTVRFEPHPGVSTTTIKEARP